MAYTFGEKTTEYVKGASLPVWQSPKYTAAKQKAIDIINSKEYGLEEADFWILMNTSGDKKKMVYSGLIISHNGCLKINDNLNSKFDPSCVTMDKQGYGDSLVYSYCNPAQGIYEVGEASKANCTNNYPYAMAFKRLFDRVVLKLSKLAYSGIYSDSESDEFVQRFEYSEHDKSSTRGELLVRIKKLCPNEEKLNKSCYSKFGKNLGKLDDAELAEVIRLLEEKQNAADS